jgi:hypothetical protein
LTKNIREIIVNAHLSGKRFSHSVPFGRIEMNGMRFCVITATTLLLFLTEIPKCHCQENTGSYQPIQKQPNWTDTASKPTTMPKALLVEPVINEEQAGYLSVLKSQDEQAHYGLSNVQKLKLDTIEQDFDAKVKEMRAGAATDDNFRGLSSSTADAVSAVLTEDQRAAVKLDVRRSARQAQEVANRVKCASNEKMILQGAIMYANDHQGNFPPNLGILFAEYDLTADVFVCPSSQTGSLADVAKQPKDLQTAWIDTHSDYIWLGAGKNNSAPPDMVILREKPDDHAESSSVAGGMNFGFANGHVEFYSEDQAKHILQELQAGHNPPQ